MFRPHQLECPLGDSSHGLGVLDDLPEWIHGHHSDGVHVEVMPELSHFHQDRIHKFLHL
jgi:hypothetical protein